MRSSYGLERIYCKTKAKSTKYIISSPQVHHVLLSTLFLDAPNITSHTPTVTVLEGQNITLSCGATGHPTPLVTWTKTDDPSTILANATSYHLLSAGRGAAGTYRCTASNGAGPDASAVAVVDVECKIILGRVQLDGQLLLPWCLWFFLTCVVFFQHADAAFLSFPSGG